VGQGGARSLMTLADQGARRWESAFNRSEKFFVKRDLKDPWNKNLLLEPIADRSPGLGKENLYYYASLPFRVASTPFVDSIGSSAWENMVRRTRTGVHRPREFEINIEPSIREQIKADIKRFPRGTGGFAKFFHMIEMCYGQANGSKPIHADPKSTDCFVNPKIFSNVELTVIGHSMGTIVINELLPLFRELPVKDIVYMASAASVRDSKRSLAPLLSHEDNSKHSQKFYNLMLHPMNDAQELAVKGMAPSGSLLAWIDEMYENPRTMLDRKFGKWRNVRATKHIFRPES